MSETDLQYSIIVGYRFFDLQNPAEIRALLKTECETLKIVGTIILSHEGINLYIAGIHDSVAQLKSRMSEKFKFPSITYKENRSARLPWRRMIVKVKEEIISLGIPDIRPAEFTAKTVSPNDFKKWMDEKRDMVVFDTRNDYEVQLGKFNGAIDLQIQTFREFPKKIGSLPEDMKEKTVVMYCTGGIRCEKASALLLKQHGFKEVFQLDGGILNYFKAVGAAHYEGECLVFDRRVGLNGSEEEKNDCLQCGSPLSPQDYDDPKLVPFRTCPRCFHIT